ncbi:MAG: succinate dehydrogenase, cytochrome b556 subunit [Burkholderiales bacterium]|nr:succinate dehydrogenase, cytochrome b556 subunit [Burkholderiales bacterium]
MRRPVYLDLLRIRQPLPAIVSILHRASGILLFLLLPAALYLFELSLSGEAGFRKLRQSLPLRAVVTLLLIVYVYHLLAGLRFLVFDLHRPGLYRHARSSAVLVLGAAAAVALVIGVALWGGGR